MAIFESGRLTATNYWLRYANHQGASITSVSPDTSTTTFKSLRMWWQAFCCCYKSQDRFPAGKLSAGVEASWPGSRWPIRYHIFVAVTLFNSKMSLFAVRLGGIVFKRLQEEAAYDWHINPSGLSLKENLWIDTTLDSPDRSSNSHCTVQYVTEIGAS